jgi:ribonucleotide monophosphatase NagD (HAD superfamily)
VKPVRAKGKSEKTPQRLGVSEKETVFVGDTVDADIPEAKSIRYFAD